MNSLQILFTFHYVSISTLIRLIMRLIFLHLHSTMYLFQLVPLLRLYMDVLTFTFHYVSISTIRIPHIRHPGTHIYIPLCIYFNAPLLLLCMVALTFTFHYVSISTSPVADDAPLYPDLHSTMYLFQPQIFRSLISIRIIVALLSTKQTSIIFILTCSGNIWIITDKIRIVDLPVILQYYVPTVKA